MKGASDPKPIVPIVVGVLGLVAVTIAVRHCGTSASPDSAAGPQLASNSASRRNAAGGWIAQPGQGNSGSERSRSGASSGRMGGGDSRGTTARGSDPDDYAPPHGGSGAGDRDFRDTDTMDAGGDAIPAQRRAPSAGGTGGATTGNGTTGAAAMGDGAIDTAGAGGTAGKPSGATDHGGKANSGKTNGSQTEDVAEVKDPEKAGTQDDTGPVYSLPLEKTTEPEAGQAAPIVANGVTFDANGAHFAANSQMFIPDGGNVDPAAGTITFWILPEWAGNTEGDAQLVHLGSTTFENHATFFKNGRYLRFLFADDSGYEAGGGHDVSDWKPGDRHMVTGTWGDGVTVLYLDGTQVDAHDYAGTFALGPNPPFVIGTGSPNIKGGANSNLTRLQVYTRALSSDEVANMFVNPPS